MLRLNAFESRLPFHYPFTIAKGTKTEQEMLVVSLGFGKLTGWGEAPAISYYDVNVSGMMEALEQVRPVIERYSLTDPQRFWHFLHHLLPGQNFLIGALDAAGWDLFSQLRKKPLFAALGLSFAPVLCYYTIGLDTPEIMLAKMKVHPASVYKIKLAKPGDIDILRLLRAASDAAFRVDVNEGWNYADTLRLLPELQKLGVKLLEQPLPRDAWEEMQALKSQSPISLFADESCREEQDIQRCAPAFHGINIKLAKCGGISPAMRMISIARAQGMQIMLGSMNEGTIGAAAIVHMSSTADFLDADGPLLLAGDNATGLHYDAEGYVSLAAGTGLCVQVKTL